MSDWEKFIEFLLNDFDIIDDDKKECEIIDIANEEMKHIDSSKMDSEYKKVFTEEITQNLINLVYSEEWTQKDINSYFDMLETNYIADIRISSKNIYIKTTGDISQETLSNIIGLDKKYIEPVPIYGKYAFYLIDTTKCAKIMEKPPMSVYEPKQLVAEIMTIAQNPHRDATTIKEIIEDALYENWEDYIDTYFDVEIEDQVIAIGFGRYISDAKEVFSEVFSINPKLFIEVSTPFETILLIDSCRWDLDPNFGGEQWYR